MKTVAQFFVSISEAETQAGTEVRCTVHAPDGKRVLREEFPREMWASGEFRRNAYLSLVREAADETLP